MSPEQTEYTVVVHEEDGTFWAEVPALAGCFASGRTLDELKEAVEEAIALCRGDGTEGLETRASGRMQIGEIRVSVPG